MPAPQSIRARPALSQLAPIVPITAESGTFMAWQSHGGSQLLAIKEELNVLVHGIIIGTLLRHDDNQLASPDPRELLHGSFKVQAMFQCVGANDHIERIVRKWNCVHRAPGKFAWNRLSGSLQIQAVKHGLRVPLADCAQKKSVATACVQDSNLPAGKRVQNRLQASGVQITFTVS